MIRRKVVVATIVIMVAVISIAAWVGRNMNMLKDLDSSDIEEITFLYAYEYITITEPSDVQILFEALQSMKLKKILNYHKYGTTLPIDLKLKSGEKISMTILSDDVMINGRHYKPVKDYCDNIRNIYSTLSQKYLINPN